MVEGGFEENDFVALISIVIWYVLIIVTVVFVFFGIDIGIAF